MEIVIPDTFEVTTLEKGKGEKVVTVHNEHTGSIALPDKWTGKDLDEWPDKLGFTAWMEQWQWAKERVVDWQIKDLPTNPMQLDDNDLPWHLMNFITKAAYDAMYDYTFDGKGQWDDNLIMPEPAALTAGEFLAYNETSESVKPVSGTLGAFRSYTAFVRQWPDGENHDPDGMAVDLSLITAVVDRGNEILQTAIDLGNLLVPPGRHSTKKAS